MEPSFTHPQIPNPPQVVSTFGSEPIISGTENEPNLNQPKPLKPRGNEVRESSARPQKLAKDFLDQDAKVTSLFQKDPHAGPFVGCFTFSIISLTVGALCTGVAVGLSLVGLWPLGVIFGSIAVLCLITGAITAGCAFAPHSKSMIKKLIQNEKGLTPEQKRMLGNQSICDKHTNVMQMQMLALHIKHDPQLSNDDKVRLLNQFAGKKISPANVVTLKREYQEAKAKKAEEPEMPKPVKVKVEKKPEVEVAGNPFLEELQQRVKEREERLRGLAPAAFA